MYLVDKNEIMSKAIKSKKITPELKKLRDVAYQRIKQLGKLQKKAGGDIYSSALDDLGGNTSFNISPRNKNYLDEINRMITFINNPTSTSKGVYENLEILVDNKTGKKISWVNIKEFVKDLDVTKWDLEKKLKQYLESGQNFLSSLGSAERQSTVDSFLKQKPTKAGNNDETFNELLEYMAQSERAEQLARQLKNKGTFIIPE